MNNYLSEPLVFLVEILFGLYITVVMLRFLFQLLRMDFYNPVSQAIVKVTNPPLRALRRVVPSIGKIDTSSIILMLTLQYLSFVLIMIIIGAQFLPLALLFLSIIELINHAFNIFIFSIIILAVLSWISSPYQQNPIAPLLEQLTRPVMRPARRLIPPMGGVDFSPMIALIALFFFKMLLIPPLQGLARHIAM